MILTDRECGIILEAEDGETGLELFYQARPDLVICDIMMRELEVWRPFVE